VVIQQWNEGVKMVETNDRKNYGRELQVFIHAILALVIVTVMMY